MTRKMTATIIAIIMLTTVVWGQTGDVSSVFVFSEGLQTNSVSLGSNSVSSGSNPQEQIEHKIEYAKRLIKLNYLGAAIEILIEVMELQQQKIKSTNTIEWTGLSPSGHKESAFYGYPDTTGYIKILEIGFRSDGVIVWRNREAK